MEQYQKISSRIIIVLAFVWAALTATGNLSTGQSYFMIGAISAYIGVQNIILLNWGQRTGRLPRKIVYLIEQHGHNSGILRYTLINILLFLLIGLFVMGCAWTLL